MVNNKEWTLIAVASTNTEYKAVKSIDRSGKVGKVEPFHKLRVDQITCTEKDFRISHAQIVMINLLP